MLPLGEIQMRIAIPADLQPMRLIMRCPEALREAKVTRMPSIRSSTVQFDP